MQLRAEETAADTREALGVVRRQPADTAPWRSRRPGFAAGGAMRCATACAVVAAESTIRTCGGKTERIAAARIGKCVQPSTSVSGASAAANKGSR